MGRVQGVGRFVQKQDIRFLSQSAGQKDALAFSPGQFAQRTPRQGQSGYGFQSCAGGPVIRVRKQPEAAQTRISAQQHHVFGGQGQGFGGTRTLGQHFHPACAGAGVQRV